MKKTRIDRWGKQCIPAVFLLVGCDDFTCEDYATCPVSDSGTQVDTDNNDHDASLGDKSSEASLSTEGVTSSAGDVPSSNSEISVTITVATQLDGSLECPEDYPIADALDAGNGPMNGNDTDGGDTALPPQSSSSADALDWQDAEPEAGSASNTNDNQPSADSYGISSHVVNTHDADGVDASTYFDSSFGVDEPLLESLTLSYGSLSPPFDPEHTEYQVSVPSFVQRVGVIPTHSKDASVAILGASISSGAEWTTPVLSLGQNTFVLLAERGDKPSREYTLQINRGPVDVKYVKASNSDAEDEFGHAMALSADGTTLAISAWGEDSDSDSIGIGESDNTAEDAGAVYVFDLTSAGWLQQAYIKSPNSAENDRFGTAVSLAADGNTLAIGSTSLPDETSGAGAAFVYHRVGSGWSAPDYLTGSADNPAGFGRALSLSADGRTLAVGAAYETVDDLTGVGAAYVYRQGDKGWVETAHVFAHNREKSDYFGSSVDLSGNGNTLVVGAYGESSDADGVGGDPNNNDQSHAGAAYVFELDDEARSDPTYLKASNSDEMDMFGDTLAVSRDGRTIAVGAWRESGNATGVGGDGTNNEAGASGAVYVFEKTSTGWSQPSYLKASNTETVDSFGRSLALSDDGRILAIGADGEDSNASGIGGDRANNELPASGAVFVYQKLTSDWSGPVYVKAAPNVAATKFGSVVRISGNGSTLLVAGLGDDSDANGVGGDPSNTDAPQAGAVYIYK